MSLVVCCNSKKSSKRYLGTYNIHNNWTFDMVEEEEEEEVCIECVLKYIEWSEGRWRHLTFNWISQLFFHKSLPHKTPANINCWNKVARFLSHNNIVQLKFCHLPLLEIWGCFLLLYTVGSFLKFWIHLSIAITYNRVSSIKKVGKWILGMCCNSNKQK